MTSLESQTRRFTVDEYHRMAEAGIFEPEERVELILGVVRRMSPKSRRHVLAVARLNRLLSRTLAGRSSIFVQDPLFAPELQSEPEPDLFLTSSADPRDYVEGRSHPLLVIEVADTSLEYDRSTKAELYARAGVPELWLVNLVDDLLEIHRDPSPDGYRAIRRLSSGEEVSPVSWPDANLPVDAILPPRVSTR